MNILSLDTSTNACSVALSQSGMITERHEVTPRQQSQNILAYVQDLLNEADLMMSDIDLIACGIGPGSFMGVRLAVSVAKGLAFAAGIRVMPYSSLYALAQSACDIHSVSHCVAAWDARMGEIYCGEYQLHSQGVMVARGSDVLVSPAKLSLPGSSELVLVGNAWGQYSDQLDVNFKHDYRVIDELYPRARAAFSLMKNENWQSLSLAPGELSPVYLRAAVT